jgi:SOS response regulatory protein OraA/RecX
MNIQSIEQKLSKNLIDNSFDPVTIKSCYKHAIKLLAHKDYSRHKLTTKLIEKDYPEILVDELVELLVEEKYLREDYYKEARIKGLLNKGYHPRYITQKMLQEQCPVTDEEIGTILGDYQLSDYKMLRELIEKKLRIIEAIGQTNAEKKWDKVMRFVISKGHCANTAKSILRELHQ